MIMRSEELFPKTSRIRAAARAAIGTLLITACIVSPTSGHANDVTEGQRVWAEKAQCPECHGWAGNGEHGSLHSAGNAPSLRLTQLTRDQIRMTIQCGRPGTPMPYFDRFAYTDKRCYDMTEAEAGDQMPNRGAITLQSYEIDELADYIETKIKGSGPVTRSHCVDFFKANAGA